MTVIGVIVARAGSSRLPRKMLLPFGCGTILQTVIARSKKCRLIEKLVLATTVSEADDPIAKIADRTGTPVVRGSEKDVVGRMLTAIESIAPKADIVVRICADNPILMPTVVDDAISVVISDGLDLITYAERPTIPFGYSCVVMTKETLERIDRETKKSRYREHVENYCLDNPSEFNLRYQVAHKQIHFPELQLSLDYESDYHRLRYWFKRIEKFDVGAQPEKLVELVRSSRIYIETQGFRESPDLERMLFRTLGVRNRLVEDPARADIAFYLRKPPCFFASARSTFWFEVVGPVYKLWGQFQGSRTPVEMFTGSSSVPVTPDSLTRFLVPALIKFLVAGFPRPQEIGNHMMSDVSKIMCGRVDRFRDFNAVLFPPTIVFEDVEELDEETIEFLLEEILFFGNCVRHLVFADSQSTLKRRLERSKDLSDRGISLDNLGENVEGSSFDRLSIIGRTRFQIGNLIMSVFDPDNCRLRISEIWQSRDAQVLRAKEGIG